VQKIITSSQIREQLRQFDSRMPWGKKISTTENLLDAHFQHITKDEFSETVVWANQRIAMEFGVHPVAVPSLYKTHRHDCENFAGALVAFANIRFAKMDWPTTEPAIFRIIARLPDNQIHAYNICFTQQGLWYADLLRGTEIWQEKPEIVGFG